MRGAGRSVQLRDWLDMKLARLEYLEGQQPKEKATRGPAWKGISYSDQ